MADFQLLLLGRFVFALGYESINVLKGMIVSDWFFGAELSTANSINLSFVRGIVFISGAFTPLIMERTSLTGAFVAGCMICLLSVGATSYLIKYQNRLDNEKQEDEQGSSAEQLNNSEETENRFEDVVSAEPGQTGGSVVTHVDERENSSCLGKLWEIFDYPKSFWLLTCAVVS